jgi:hypothetical protein
MTGLKSGQIFQGAKGFANSTGKLVSNTKRKYKLVQLV